MVAQIPGRIALFGGLFMALSSCDEAGNFTLLQPKDAGSEAAEAAPSEPVTRGGTQVVEAPDVFDVTDEALWDGRPSLGNIWVAYEGADPLSVVMRNEETGAEITGALFRRERFFPGPPFQLSSDAAAELGILAGQPTRIRVTALVEEEIAPPEPVDETGSDSETAVAAAAGAGAAGAEVVEETAEAASEGGADAIAGAAAAIAAAEAVSSDAVIQEPALPAPRPVTQGPNAPDPIAVVAAASVPEVTTTTESLGGEGLAVESAAVVAASAPAPTPAPSPAPASSLSRPFVQVGSFSSQENAEAAAQALRDNGVVPIVEASSGGSLWRVIVGPAQSSDERAALLEKVKSEGFDDAFFVAQ
ncbi:MAG: SPOR domain-containing protein [Pseudomonadota bacterium]